MEASIDKALKEYIKKMPSLPTSVSKVLEICNNPHTSPADLNHIISLDPVLAGRVLKLINSAYYGLEKPVTNLARAIIMLGINTVKNLALSTIIVDRISAKGASAGLNMEGFWRHSLCVGVSAKLLAKKRGVDIKLIEEFFTAGLIHDIGKIPLNALFSKEYMLTVGVADKNREPFFQAEESVLGLNHCKSGALITGAWKLEGAIGDVIEHHHSYEEYSGNHKEVLYSIIAANRFASISEIGFSGNCHPAPALPVVWETLDVPPDIFDEIEKSVNNEIEKAEIFLRIGRQ